MDLFSGWWAVTLPNNPSVALASYYNVCKQQADNHPCHLSLPLHGNSQCVSINHPREPQMKMCH